MVWDFQVKIKTVPLLKLVFLSIQIKHNITTENIAENLSEKLLKQIIKRGMPFKTDQVGIHLFVQVVR